MQTHKDVWWSNGGDISEWAYFNTRHQPFPVLEFIPWPIKVRGIIFEDGSEQYTAGGGGGTGTALIAGPGISLTPGMGTMTITNTWPQSPWQGNVNANNFSITNLNRVGIGTNNPQYSLDVAGNINITDPGAAGGYTFRINGLPFTGTPAGANTQIQWNNAGVFGAAPLFVYTAAGHVGIGTATPIAPLTVDTDSNGRGISCRRYSNDSVEPTFYLHKGRGTEAAPLPVQVGDWCGYIGFGGTVANPPAGFTGADIAAIQATVTGVNPNDLAGDLIFFTNDGTGPAGVAYERVRITSIGDVGIGGTPVAEIGMELFHGELRVSGTGIPATGKGVELWYRATAPIEGGMENYNYDLGHYEQMRFQANPLIINAPWSHTGNTGPVPGYVGLGTETPQYKLDVNGDVNVSAGHVYRIDGVPITGAKADTDPTPPSNPGEGQFWFDSGNLRLFVRHSNAWFQVSA